MKYKDLKKIASFGDTTAFVYDSPNNRYQYSSGEITDDVFQNITSETEITLSPIQDFPEVQEVIIDNFLAELKPAKGVEDGGYNYVKHVIPNSLIASWQEESKYGCDTIITTVYMLILGEIDTMEDLADYINSQDEFPLDVEDIIEENGWTSDTGEIYGICHNDEKRLIFDGDGNTAIVIANGEFTYDVMFNDDTKSDTMGYHSSLQECINFIDLYNGNPNVPYFGDYKGGIVQIINNETKEVVFSAEVL